jgi:hypothetical protein
LLVSDEFYCDDNYHVQCNKNTDLGFTPSPYNSPIVDFGLWSFESPDGSCVSHRDALVDYSWAVSLKDTGGGGGNWFVNSDVSWTTSRVFALFGVLFGSTALVS